MSNKVELDAFHKHEAMDRAWMFADMLGDQLADHPYIESDPALKKMAEDAIGSLYKLYQEIGSRDEPIRPMRVPAIDLPEWPKHPAEPRPYSLDGSPIKVNHE